MRNNSNQKLENASIEKMLENQQKLEALISSSFDAIIAIDSNKKVITFNRQAEVLSGYLASEIIGKSVEMLYESKTLARKFYNKIRKNGEINRSDIVLVKKDGRKIPISFSGKLIEDDSKKIIGQVGYLKDLRDIQLFESRLKALIETSKEVNSTSNISDILESVVRSALQSTPAADRGSIHFYNEKSRELNLEISSFDYSRKSLEALKFQIGEGLIGWVFEHQQTLNTGDTVADKRYREINNLEVKPQRSMLCVPITIEQRKIGVMSLSHSTQLNAFSQADLELLVSFSNQAAVAIENSEKLLKAQEETEELEFLYSLSLKINSQHNIEEILNIILNKGNKLLGTEMAVVHWRGRGNEKTQTYVAPTKLQNLLTAPRDEGGLTAEIFQRGEPIVIANIEQDKRVNPLVREVGIQSLVGYPLHLLGKVAGALFFNSRQRQFFGKREIHLISLLLPIAAIAIENSNIIERLNRAQSLSDSLMIVSSKLAATRELDDQMIAVKQFIEEDLAAPMFYLGLYDKLQDVIHLKICNDFCAENELISISLKNQPEDTISSFIVKKHKPIIWYTKTQKQDKCQRLGISPQQKGASCQTSLAYPLVVEGNILGIISIQSENPYAWDEIETSIFQTLAHQVSIAIHNIQLMKENDASFKRLQNTFKASEKIILELEPDRALDVLVSSICSDVDAIRACAILIDEEGKPFHLSSKGFDDEFKLDLAFRKNGISSRVFDSGKPKFIKNILSTKKSVHPKLKEQNVLSAACLPLTYKNIRLGVLWIHYDQPHYFLQREEEVLRLVTNQAAIAYQNATLRQKINETRDIAKLVAEMTVLGDLENTLDFIVKGVKDVLGCDIVTLWTYWEDKDQFDYQPATAGKILFPEEVTKTKTVDRSATPYKIINMKKGIHVAELTREDDILNSPFAKRENIISSVAVPLKTHDRRVGVLFINYANEKHNFTKEDRSSIQLFSLQAAIAIRNAMLYEEMQNRRGVLKIIDEAGRTVTGSLHLNEIISNLAHQALNLTGEKGEIAHFVTISLIEGNHSVIKASYPTPEKNKIARGGIAKVDLKTGVNGRIGIIGRAVKNKTPLLVKNVKDHPDYIPYHPETNCELAVPIIFKKEVIGVINIEHEKIDGLDKDDMQDINSLAAHAAVGISNARLYEASQRKSQNQQALYEVSKIINFNMDMTQSELFEILVKLMVTKIIPDVGATNILGVINLFDAKTMEQTMICTYPENAINFHHLGLVRSLRNPPDGKTGITGRALIKGKPQRVGDVSQDDDYIKFNESTKSELDVPIFDGNTVVGVLSLECDQLNGFDEQAEETLCAFADLAAIAVKNTRRYQILKETRATVGNITAVAWMGLISSAWRHTIGNMASTIFDISILAQNDLEKGVPIEEIDQRLIKIQEIVNEIRNIPMLPLSSESGIEQIYICTLVRDRINQFKSKKGKFSSIYFNLEIEIDELALVRASPEWLRRILDIIVDNASNAIDKCDNKFINTIIRMKNEGVEILISDSGSGIPDHIRPLLFKEPISKKKNEKGSGIGLFLSNTVIQVYHGKLEIVSTGPDGTTMGMWLPLLK